MDAPAAPKPKQVVGHVATPHLTESVSKNLAAALNENPVVSAYAEIRALAEGFFQDALYGKPAGDTARKPIHTTLDGAANSHSEIRQRLNAEAEKIANGNETLQEALKRSVQKSLTEAGVKISGTATAHLLGNVAHKLKANLVAVSGRSDDAKSLNAAGESAHQQFQAALLGKTRGEFQKLGITDIHEALDAVPYDHPTTYAGLQNALERVMSHSQMPDMGSEARAAIQQELTTLVDGAAKASGITFDQIVKDAQRSTSDERSPHPLVRG